LDIGGPEVVRGSWAKVLASYSGLLGWNIVGGEKTRIQLVRGSSVVGNVNVTARHVGTLYDFLGAGLSTLSSEIRRNRPKTVNYLSTKTVSVQHPMIQSYLLPAHSSAFAYLNLFSSGQTDPQLSSHDIPSRRIQFDGYITSILAYLHDLSAELSPSEFVRQPNQSVVDDLQVTIVRILSLVKQVYMDDTDDIKQPWLKEWKRCIQKMASMIESRSRSEGGRKLTREWELANLEGLV